MYLRTPLPSGTRITLVHKESDVSFQRIFTIHKSLNLEKGSNCLCYSASHATSAAGVLREYYPNNGKWTRTSDNGLLFSETSSQSKADMKHVRADYLSRYNLLLKAKKKNPELSSCIPYFEIYTPLSGDSFYVFSVEPECMTFEQICLEFYSDSCIRKLSAILECLITLTRCLQLLHEDQLYHADLNPANFGYLMRANELMTQKLTFFDLNSFLTDQNTDILNTTPEYCDPRIAFAPVSCQSDLYTVGKCLLFGLENLSADLKTDSTQSLSKIELPDFVTQNEPLYRQLKLLLSKSTGEDRYQSAEEMEKDLQKALRCLWTPVICRQNKEFHQQKKIRTQSLWYHFFQQPLNSLCTALQKRLQILVLGDGEWVEDYLDLLLQASQIGLDCEIQILGMADWSNYLDARPALPLFYSVNNSKIKYPYATIQFNQSDFDSQNPKTLFPVLENFFSDCKNNFDLILISLKNEKKTRQTARLVRSFNKTSMITSDAQIRAVLPDTVTAEKIEQMGFNTHLIWCKDKIISLEEKKQEYLHEYNHRSSLGCILFLKARMQLLGINISDLTIDEWAQRYSELLNSLDSLEKEELLNNLSWIEHRRWTAEKIALGYTPSRSEEHLSGSTYDQIEKKHICLVASNPNNLLERAAENLPNFWQEQPDSITSEFDDLDKVSLDYYSYQSSISDLLLEANFIDREPLQPLKRLLKSEPHALKAIQELENCANEVINGSQYASVLFLIRKRDCLKQIKSLSPSIQVHAQALVDRISEHMIPFLNASRHYNLKKADTNMIEHLPFVMTWTENACLIFPVDCNSIDRILLTISRANPSSCILMTEDQNFSLAETISAKAQKFIDQMALQTKIQIIKASELLAPCAAEKRAPDSLPESLPLFFSNLRKSFDYLGLEENNSSCFKSLKDSCLQLEKHCTLFTVNAESGSIIEKGKRKMLEYCYETDLTRHALQNVLGQIHSDYNESFSEDA